MSDTYKTIKNQSEGLYKEKGSKFLSFAIPVEDVEELKEILKEYRKQFYDARHVCFAHMLGADRMDFRSNDDGEPSGTAGRSILGQINSKELTNILIIVVRYFGGTLLGTGGLVTAYKEAALDAINNAEIIEKTVDAEYIIFFEYPLMNDVMRIVKESEAQIMEQGYENNCMIHLKIRKLNSELLKGKLEKIEGLTIKDDIQT